MKLLGVFLVTLALVALSTARTTTYVEEDSREELHSPAKTIPLAASEEDESEEESAEEAVASDEEDEVPKAKGGRKTELTLGDFEEVYGDKKKASREYKKYTTELAERKRQNEEALEEYEQSQQGSKKGSIKVEAIKKPKKG